MLLMRLLFKTEFHDDDMVTMGSLDIDIEWNFWAIGR